MSEERIIRINKVLRELNISLERAVDYLKDKGIAIEASPNTKISDDVYNILCGQFAGDKGNKEASKEVGEEKRKEKEALRLEREKEIEDKRKQDEERQRLEIIKAKAVVAAPKQVGTIDLSPKSTPTPVVAAPKPIVEKPVVEKPVVEKPVVVAEPVKEEAPVVAKETPVVPVKEASEKATPMIEKSKEKITEKPVVEAVEKPTQAVAEETPVDETFTTQYTKLSGATLTGQVIDLSQFNKPKKKKEEPKKDNKIVPGTPQTAAQAAQNAANKNKRKRIPPKPGEPRPEGYKPAITAGGNAGAPRPGGGKFVAKPGFQKGARPAIVQKVEPTEE
jgi:translation initiation factor IF-2